jgi:shikimate dehydrogenase
MRTFGLIGYPLGHSFSRHYFTEKFLREHISGCDYVTFPIPSIVDLPALLGDPSLLGLNVTIPYKEQVLAYLDDLDPVVTEIGACNCIKIERGDDGAAKLYGYNTDVIGFERSLVKKLQSHHDHALILGTGGAAKAVEYVLRKLGIAYRLVSRNPRPGVRLGSAGSSGQLGDEPSDLLSYEEVDDAVLSEHTLIINTTPLGMSPRLSECPLLPYGAVTPRHYLFDLVYNPARTLFLENGKRQGAVTENGYEMLVIQAEESWRIWNG